jgi:hypothetical protein
MAVSVARPDVLVSTLLLAGPVARRRRGGLPSSEPVTDARQNPQKGGAWVQRSLSEPRLLLAFAIGALIGFIRGCSSSYGPRAPPRS